MFSRALAGAAVLFGVLGAAAPSATSYSVKLSDSTTTINDAFAATFSGRSSDGKFGISLRGNSGTVTQNGKTTNVVVNTQIPWSPYTLYGLIGVNSDAIMMGWVYCEGNSLVDLWIEDTTGAAGFTSSQVTGSCSVSQNTDNVQFHTPSEVVKVTPPSSYPTINGGSNLSLQPGREGNVVLNGANYDLIPFTIVDCSSCNSGNVDGGWIEVHSVMSNPSSGNVCMGIFYLPLKHTPQISLDYVNCFKQNVGDQSFQATYTLPSQMKQAVSANKEHPFEAMRNQGQSM